MSNNDLSRVPPWWPNRSFSQTLKLSGIDWHFQMSRHPDPNAETILLIHGTGSSAHSWTDIFPLLAKNYTVIAPDLPGHGFTQGAKKLSLHIDMVAQSLSELITGLGVSHVNAMIGHSAGATCALALSPLMDDAPQTIVGLNPALVNPLSMYNLFLGPVMNPFATSGMMAGILATSLPMTGMVDQLLDSTNSILNETQRKPYRTLYADQGHIYGALNFMTASNIEELLQHSSKITSNFTFLVASQDPWVPQITLLPVIHHYFPQAVVEIEEGGHLFHEIKPMRAMQIIQHALNGSRKGKSAEYA
jgi:magnesium chelatase accessory protein